MQVNVEDVTAVKKRLEVALPAEEVRAELDRAFERVQRRARIKGFRPGKVPRQVLERHFGAQVRDEVTAQLIARSYRQAVSEKGLEVVAEPRIDDVEAASGETGLRFRAIVEVKPRLEVRDYIGLEVELITPEVHEKDVEDGLERLRQMHAQMAAIEGRDEVAAGDLVLLDYTAIVNGRPLPAASATDRVIEVGAGALPAQFEEQLVGMRGGETRRVEVSFPPSHPNPSLAGKKVAFRVEIKRLGRKELPALDDEFAKDCGEATSLAELREKIRAGLCEESRRRAERSMRARVLDRLVERNPVEVPEGMVETRLDALLRELGVQPDRSDQRGEPASQRIDEIRAKLKPQAVRDVRSALLLEEVARQEGIEASEEEVRNRMAMYLAGSGAQGTQAARMLENVSIREHARDQLLREKALALLVTKAKIVRTHDDSQVIADEQKKS